MDLLLLNPSVENTNAPTNFKKRCLKTRKTVTHLPIYIRIDYTLAYVYVMLPECHPLLVTKLAEYR
jgi:hypothetical protein